MKLRALTEYRLRNGKVKRIRLFAAWQSMQQRVAGTTTAGNGHSRPWIGLPIGFTDWLAFRTWSLANGYSRERCSLDRKVGELGYTPGNCEWISRAENTRRARAARSAARRHQIQAELRSVFRSIGRYP